MNTCASNYVEYRTLRTVDLFATIMDVLTKNIKTPSPWNMMFADDADICSETKEEVEKLKDWRKALEERGLKVSRNKTVFELWWNGNWSGGRMLL